MKNIFTCICCVLIFLVIFETSNAKDMQTMRLQSIGLVEGTPAGELRPGHIMLWNFGERSQVAEIVKETEKSITIIETSTKTGKRYERRFLKSRLVCIVNK